jgi:hypothetical protein
VKRKLLAVVLIAVITLSFVALFVRQMQNDVNKLPKVKIVSVRDLGGFNPVAGLLIESEAIVTVKNYGASNVSGLTLYVTLFHNDTGKAFDNGGFLMHVDALNAGETRDVKAPYYWGLSSENWTNAILMAYLLSGNLTIDKMSGNLKQ